MSLEKANISWSAKQLSGMIKNGKINFDHIIQRSYVWERNRKSSLIESLIVGYPVPPVYAKRLIGEDGKSNNKVYYIMDGKQRLSSVKEYLNDEFPLTRLRPVIYMDDELGKECETDISGMRFSELPEALQQLLNTVSFNVIYFDNLTDEEERELFKRLNAGKPLSTKSKALASCKDIEGFLDIGTHRLFSKMLTDKARANKNQVMLVMKTWCMLNKNIDDISFESRVFNPLLEKTEISEAEKLAMVEVFDLIANTHSILIERREKKVAKKLYTETHLISLIPYFKRAIENSISEEMIADWLVSFFDEINGASVSEDYNSATGSGSAKNINIIARDKALSESYNNFFKTDDESESAETIEVDKAEVTDSVEESHQDFTDEVMEDMESYNNESE